MNAMAFFLNLCARMESQHPHLRTSTLLSAPSIEYKGRAFATIHEDNIVLKLKGNDLPPSRQIGWQYYKPYGRQIFLQQWVEVPYYFHQEWQDLVERALHGLKDTLGE